MSVDTRQVGCDCAASVLQHVFGYAEDQGLISASPAHSLSWALPRREGGHYSSVSELRKLYDYVQSGRSTLQVRVALELLLTTDLCAGRTLIWIAALS
ncbi:MAG: hypothetical protein IJU76_10490 [Desulfovibrionaceae bacterium]|nr:hypothetical protein [Desulfovibrionaceae bacterium]